MLVWSRYKWVYVYAFVCPETGENEFWPAPSINTEMFTQITAAFLRKRPHAVMLVWARPTGTSRSRRVLQNETFRLKHLPLHSLGLISA